MTREDFRKRTFQFGIRCIKLAESLPKSTTCQIVAKQLIRSATSVGANYRSAIRARSAADFAAKLGIVEEECDESLYWIDVIIELGLKRAKRTSDLQREANEIVAIIVSSIKTTRKNNRLPASKRSAK
jgi:four helix bundle protein